MLFAGWASKTLANSIAEDMGIQLGQVTMKKFSDGERNLQIRENVRNKHVFIINSTGPNTQHFVDLLLLMDAIRGSSAGQMTVIIPYFGYSRQERKDKPHVPISARVMADCIESQRPSRLIFCDLHSAAIPAFFRTTSDHIYARPIFLDHIREKFADQLDNMVLVAPDAGAAKISRSYAQRLGVPIAIIDKRRPKENKAEVMHIVGDVDGKTCIMIDDMIDTAGTMTSGAVALMEHGATGVHAMTTHGVLSGPALQRINDSPIESVMVTDTVNIGNKQKKCSKIEIVSMAGILSEAIKRTYSGESLSALFYCNILL
ncbi:MAG: ribose-phosphate diphosphokinase [Candidatus Komeilibacteria bacterium]